MNGPIIRADFIAKATLMRDMARKLPLSGNEGCLLPVTLYSETQRSEILMLKIFREEIREKGKLLDGKRVDPEEFSVRACEKLRGLGLPVVDFIAAKEGALFMTDFRIDAYTHLDGADFIPNTNEDLAPPNTFYFKKHALEIFGALGKIHASGFTVDELHPTLSIFFIVLKNGGSELLLCDYANLEQCSEVPQSNELMLNSLNFLLDSYLWGHTREELMQAYDEGKESINSIRR